VVEAARGVVLVLEVNPPSLNGAVVVAGVVVVVAGFERKELVSGEATAGAVLPPGLNGVVDKEN